MMKKLKAWLKKRAKKAKKEKARIIAEEKEEEIAQRAFEDKCGCTNKLLKSKIKSLESFIKKVDDKNLGWDETPKFIKHNNEKIEVNGYDWNCDTAAKYDGKLLALKELLKEVS